MKIIFKVPHKEVCRTILAEREEAKEVFKALGYEIDEKIRVYNWEASGCKDVWIVRKIQ